ncbi:ribonuclease J [Spirochaetota bacterium]
MKKQDENKVKIIPLGGLGSIGKNITLFEYNDDIIVVDCGIAFPNDEMPGIDFVIPDFSYLLENIDKIKALVITHGHEDHIGAVSYLLKEITVPIYATRFTIGLIQSRLIEKPPKEEPTFHEIKPRDIVDVGNFKIEFIGVNHSIVDGVALAISTEIGTIIHSGDFKIDFSPVSGEVTDIFRFAEYGEKGVLLLMSDSTNAEKEGFTKSESILVDKLVDIFSSSKGRIIVTTFASNIQRIQQVFDVAHTFNRKIAISGLSLQKNVEISHSLGYLNFKDDILIGLDKANSLPNKKMVIVCTGSQGEPMSALTRIANGTHRQINSQKGDTVVLTASIIPGNERTVTNVVNTLMLSGANVYYEMDENIHVSGHGSAKELKLLISITKPKFFMPIHGEYKHMAAHAKIAESLNIKSARINIAENGDILELTGKSFKKNGNLNLSQIYVDGTEIGDISSSVIKERHILSTDGIVIVTVVTSEGMLLKQPDIIIKGFIETENIEVLKLLQREVDKQINRMLKDSMSLDAIQNKLAKILKSFTFKITGMKPLTVIQVMEV